MQLVNFWLVAVSFLVAAFVQARSANFRTIAVGVCLTGAIASIAFLLLDARTRRLVKVAEEALAVLEDARVAQGSNHNMRLIAAANAARPLRVASYRVVIQGLQLTVALLFVVAGIYSAIF